LEAIFLVEIDFAGALALLVESGEGAGMMIDDADLFEAGVIILGGIEGEVGIFQGGGGIDFGGSEHAVG